MSARESRRRPSLRFRRAAAIPVAAACLGLAAGCASPPEAPLDDAVVVSTVLHRDASAEALAPALDLLRAWPLPVPRPKPAAPDPDYDDGEIWHASALAFEAGVLEARRKVLAAEAAAGSAGAPGPLMGGVENADLGGSERETDLTLTFDLLGILGIGRPAAEKALAEAETREAVGGLERAVWSAWFAVDRARVRLAAARSRGGALERLLADVEQDGKRIDLLHDRGWVAGSSATGAHAATHRVLHDLEDVHTEIARARHDLAVASGLPPSAAGLDRVSQRTLEGLDPRGFDRRRPEPLRLLASHPDLRALRLAYAVAEGRVRTEAAAALPRIGIGPKARFVPSELLPGGVLTVEIPFPGSLDGRIAAAVERREMARESLEGALARSLSVVERDVEALHDRLRAFEEHAPAIDAAAEAGWHAARARFLVDPGALDAWTAALMQRIDPLLMRFRAREEALLAGIDLAEACGPEGPSIPSPPETKP